MLVKIKTEIMNAKGVSPVILTPELKSTWEK
jgi:hypothetical protein